MDRQFEFLMYKSAQEEISVNALIKDETIWLTQKAMGELFGVNTPAISKHLKNIFAEGGPKTIDCLRRKWYNNLVKNRKP